MLNNLHPSMEKEGKERKWRSRLLEKCSHSSSHEIVPSRLMTTSQRRQYDVIFGVVSLLGCGCPTSTLANNPALSMSTDYRSIGSLSKIIEDSYFFDIFIGMVIGESTRIACD